MTLSELITAVRNILREPVAARWTDNDIKRYLNSGLSDLAKLSEKTKTSSISVTYSTSSIVIPSDVLAIKTLYWYDANSGKIELEPSVESMPDDDISTGTPEKYYLLDDNIILRPIPVIDGTLYLAYTKKPAQLLNNTDTPELKDSDDALISYAVWRAYFEDGDPRATLWENDYAKQALKWQAVEMENYEQPFRVKEWW